MKTTTIYRINEKDRTIDIAQSVPGDDESLHGAVLNTRTFTFDELMNQHRIFGENTEILDSFRDRLHSALRIGRSIDVDPNDMIARFVAEHGENIFFRGYVLAVIDFYDAERYQILKPNDVVKGKWSKKKIQDEISEHINEFMNTQLELTRNNVFFSYTETLEHFVIFPGRTIIAADNYTYHVFRESDNGLICPLAELGQIVRRNKWTSCDCGFCHKLFLDTEDAVCCHSDLCKSEHDNQKKKIYDEHTKEYSGIKNNYDAFVRRYKSYLEAVSINTRYPADFDEFIQAQKERQDKMGNLKKRLIHNGLPTADLYNLGEKFKAEMKALAEEILEQYGYNPTEVAKIKKTK